MRASFARNCVTHDGRRLNAVMFSLLPGELLAADDRAVIEVMLHEAAHALAVVRGFRDSSAEGNRYHNKRFVALAAEMGLARAYAFLARWDLDYTGCLMGSGLLADQTNTGCCSVLSSSSYSSPSTLE